MRILLFMAVIFGLFACARTAYVPQTQVRTEYQERVVRDSVVSYDSIFVLQRERGDTVYLYVDKYRYLYRDKFVRDTVFVLDSIPYPVVVREIKEVRHVPRFFRWCFWVVLASAGWRVLKIIKGRRLI